MTVFELKAELDAGKTPVLLDVRESNELEISKMDGIVAIPMGDVPARIRELDSEADTVVICRGGTRSGHVVEYLLSRGFTQVRNLEGGMNGWARNIDRSLAIY